ncbi:MAG: hypothetical protein MUP13_03215, partial [Thermoanaerobaculales bacterium]|nr:hypothetical protein [Thermoanaerobaculales bacterium]
PEKTNISWQSAVTYLPGVASVSGFELRSQTGKDQIYLRVAQAHTRISLVGLLFKTIHLRGVDAEDVDFRYRQRLDRPPKPGQEEDKDKQPENTEYWPEIPGWSNPPDPKPEDLYPVKKKKRPWVIEITGAEVEGPIKAAFGGVRIEGGGWVGGGVIVKPGETITIQRGRLGLDSTRVSFGPEVVTDDLAIDADLRFEPFPAKGAKLPDILGGVTGELSVAGNLSEKVAVSHVITPGVSTFGAGTIKASLELKDGVVRAGSEYSLESDAFHLWVMGLDASGSATVSGKTVKEKGEHVTRMHIAFGTFQFVDPDDGTVDISGTGIKLDAEWKGLSIAGNVPASSVALDLPTAEIHDVSTFNAMIPDDTAVALVSGTGQVTAKLEITERVATGTLDVAAEEIALETHDTPLMGDLEVHANLAEGDLPTRRFDLSGTTVLVDKIVNKTLSEKKQEKLDPWYIKVGFEKGHVIFGKPLAVDGSVTIDMYDTRPIEGLLKELDAGPKWLGLARTIKNVDGSLDVSLGNGYFAFDDLVMTGDGFESLGWMDIRNKKSNGRLFVRFKSVMAGVSFDEGKSKIQLSKPRKWFEEQPKGPVADASPPEVAPEKIVPAGSDG